MVFWRLKRQLTCCSVPARGSFLLLEKAIADHFIVNLFISQIFQAILASCQFIFISPDLFFAKKFCNILISRFYYFPMHVVIFDSDPARAARMERSLRATGYVCQHCRNRERLLDVIDAQPSDTLLFGFDETTKGVLPLIAQVKEKGLKKILLLAKTELAALVSEGLAAGADDYLCLPLRLHELQMRISVMARQIMPDAGQHYYLKHGDFAFGKYPNDLKYLGESIRLTAREFDLALLFFRHIGMPLSRAHIAEAIWKMDGNEMVRTIDTHVSRVRNKLNLKPKNGFLLEQVYGFGYQLLALTEK